MSGVDDVMWMHAEQYTYTQSPYYNVIHTYCALLLTVPIYQQYKSEKETTYS